MTTGESVFGGVRDAHEAGAGATPKWVWVGVGGCGEVKCFKRGRWKPQAAGGQGIELSCLAARAL